MNTLTKTKNLIWRLLFLSLVCTHGLYASAHPEDILGTWDVKYTTEGGCIPDHAKVKRIVFDQKTMTLTKGDGQKLDFSYKYDGLGFVVYLEKPNDHETIHVEIRGNNLFIFDDVDANKFVGYYTKVN